MRCLLFTFLLFQSYHTVAANLKFFCLQYDDCVFFDERITMGELRSSLYVARINYLTKDPKDPFKKVDIKKLPKNLTLKTLIGNNAPKFTVEDLKELALIDLELVMDDVIINGKVFPQNVMMDSKFWHPPMPLGNGKFQKGIKIDIFVKGEGAKYLSVDGLEKYIDKINAAKSNEEEEKGSEDSYQSDTISLFSEDSDDSEEEYPMDVTTDDEGKPVIYLMLGGTLMSFMVATNKKKDLKKMRRRLSNMAKEEEREEVLDAINKIDVAEDGDLPSI